MSPQGDDRPPERSGGSERPEKPGKQGPSKKPEYTIYGRSGREGQKREAPKRTKKEPKAGDREKPPKAGDREKPPYRVYRSRPSLRDRIRKPSLSSLRGTAGRGGFRDRLSRITGGKRPWLRWILIFAVGWLLLSFITFSISSQIQKGKLPDSAKDALEGGPDVLLGQNILILGGDRRGKTQRNATGIEAQGPPRADTIMVLHASLTSFKKLSIPRDTYASIPDCGEQRINASLACNTQSTNGNPASTIKTVENFLGIDINHIVIVDFDGFADFIDTLGGVEVTVPVNKSKEHGPVVCGDVDGGKSQGGVTIRMKPGEHHLEGQEALAFA